MNESCLAYRIKISDSDGEKTPTNVKELVEKMRQHIKQSEEKLAEPESKQQEVLEKINCRAKNSSSPPSLARLHAEKKPEKNKSGKKRGGQPGHKGHSRFLDELSECESVLEHQRETCSCCKEILLGKDSNPYRHQILEMGASAQQS